LDRISALASASPEQQAPEIHTAIEDLSFELDRLARFGEGFASFARLKPPDLRPEDLGDLIREFATTYEAAWPNLTLELDAEGRAPILADRALIRQVLANLCDNSSKALGNDEGRVRLLLDRSTRELRLLVTDDAGGIPEEIRAQLFEPYTTTRAVGEGVGLGLAISHKILLDHGGDLELVDSGGEGTTFVLTLPVRSDR
jgi:signal transduction histidine kinase